MTVRQRIHRVDGAYADHPLPNAYFDFWRIPGQGRFWKLRDGLRFELWTGGPVERFVKGGIKTRFCMRDLRQVPGLPGPRSRIFGACSQSPRARTVKMGISVGWQESYPAFYYEQYVDVTGLRGCHTLRHVADPLGARLRVRRVQQRVAGERPAAAVAPRARAVMLRRTR